MTNINVELKMVIEAFMVMSRSESCGLICFRKGVFDNGKKYLYDIIDIKKETSYLLEPKAVHDKKPIS